MPVTVRTILQPGDPQEITFEKTYGGVTSADALGAFKGFARATGMADPDAATNQQLVDHVFHNAFRWIWDQGKRAQRSHQETLLADDVPALPEE